MVEAGLLTIIVKNLTHQPYKENSSSKVSNIIMINTKIAVSKNKILRSIYLENVSNN